MSYIERPDIASLGSSATNAAIYGEAMILPTESFGPKPIALYIYNISTLEFNVPRPPNHPRLFIRACPKGESYVIAGQIEHPFTEITYDQNDNRVVRYTDGRREASKMIFPWNPGVDQDFDLPGSFAENGNLNKLGVFWSEHNPPLPAELEAAKRRLEGAYKAELEKMQAIEAKNPQNARDMASHVSHAAADYYEVSTQWHMAGLKAPISNAGKNPCPNCGELIRDDQQFHPFGNAVCVRPTGDAWEAAVNAGVKRLEDVPPIFSAQWSAGERSKVRRTTA